MALIVGLVVAGLGGTTAHGGLISPVSASGTGSYGNSTDLLIDGIIPPRNSLWFASTNVYWNGTTPEFTINLGGLYTIQDLTVAADNNDDYLVQYSTDGVAFAPLFQFVASDGPVPPSPGGTDILTTDSGFPLSPGDGTTPAYVGRGFSPVDASYLMISATAGDDAYAVGELQAFGFPAVPEPTSLFLLGIGSVGLLAFRTRMRARGS